MFLGVSSGRLGPLFCTKVPGSPQVPRSHPAAGLAARSTWPKPKPWKWQRPRSCSCRPKKLLLGKGEKGGLQKKNSSNPSSVLFLLFFLSFFFFVGGGLRVGGGVGKGLFGWGNNLCLVCSLYLDSSVASFFEGFPQTK